MQKAAVYSYQLQQIISNLILLTSIASGPIWTLIVELHLHLLLLLPIYNLLYPGEERKVQYNLIYSVNTLLYGRFDGNRYQ